MKKVSISILVVALIAAATGISSAQEKKTTPANAAGTWRWESDQQGETVEHSLRLTVNDKNEVVGVYNGMMDDLKSTKGSIKGNKLALHFDVDRDGVEFEADYDAVIKGDKASGTMALYSSQGEIELPWEATRTLDVLDVVGTWNVEIETGEQTLKPKLVVKEDGKKVSAKFVTDDVRNAVVSGLKAKDNKLMFTIKGEFEGSDFVAACTAKPSGDKFEGGLIVEMDGQRLELPISGARQTEPKMTDLVGTWNMVLEAADQDHEPKLIIKKSGDKVAVVFDADVVGQFDARKLRYKGGFLSFEMDGAIDGNPFEAECELKVTGDTMKGGMALDIAGEFIEMDLSGKRSK